LIKYNNLDYIYNVPQSEAFVEKPL